ncbi:MAG TPA: DNA polymerase III subunit delta, partial [Armatimonadetes bacterium]|nr:DNA polymerase III subunit delta [Armatimonadota bacterium]
MGRTRDEALFEFTEAFAGANLAGALLSLHRLRENGIHSLMIVAGLRNFIRKLLLARAFQEQPH